VSFMSSKTADHGVPAAQSTELETSRVAFWLSYAILLGGILTIAVALRLVVTTYSSLPFWDGWMQLGLDGGGNPLSPAWLWKQWNEHRMPIPKLFLAADLYGFQARQVFLLASILAIQFLHLALLSWSMWVLGGWRGALWRTGTGLAAFCLFCPAQQENFVWGFQVCFVLPQFLATFSFVALLLYWASSQQQADKQPASKFLVVSVLAALGATYSLASGTLLWPLLLVAALYLRLRVAAIGVFGITGVVSTALYFHDYVRPWHHANPILTLQTPTLLLKYLAVYFFSSWIPSDVHGLDIHRFDIIALIGLAIPVVGMLVPALSYVRTFRPFAILLALIMSFCLGTALITAAGRVNFGSGQAASSRYQTVALIFWCCLGLLLLGSAFFRPRMRYSFLVAQVCLLAIFVRGAALARYPFEKAQRHAFPQHATAAALLTGVYDPAPLKEVYPRVDMLLGAVPYMKANRLSVFSGDVSSELGKPLESVFSIAPLGDCAGAADSITIIDAPKGHGLRILGWVWDLKRRQPASAIVVTTDGVITGLGAVGQERLDVLALHPGIWSNYSGFIAYQPEPKLGSVVNYYAILHGSPRAVCHFATRTV
jgi:hypothetical protein